MDIVEEIIEQYKIEHSIYCRFKDKLESLIKDLIETHQIGCHKFEARVKGIEKLGEKIRRKVDRYQQLIDITDLIGLRIITYFEDDVKTISNIIENEFLIDKDNSIDKTVLDKDKFGYKSMHYVASLNNKRDCLTEYRSFVGLKFEIQIRSILQHAWAEIEHDLGYKGEITIPDSLKRDFNRVAALLETADKEFVRIRDSAKEYRANLDINIQEKPDEVDLNIDSLTSFINDSSLVKEIDEVIAEGAGMEIGEVRMQTIILTLLEYSSINNISKLNDLLTNKKNYIIPFAIKYLKLVAKATNLIRGVSILYLGYVFLVEKMDFENIKIYLMDVVGIKEIDAVNKAGIMIDIGQEIGL